MNKNKSGSKITFTSSRKKKDIPKTKKHISFCDVYKKDILGKANLPLYKSCKINQYCRKYKCKNIDKIFKQEKTKKLGANYNTLLTASLNNKCPISIPDKYKKRCNKSGMMKFYKNNNLDDIYKQVLECDNKTCAKEYAIFNKNLFRIKQKKIHIKHQLDINDLPDKEMIETN